MHVPNLPPPDWFIEHYLITVFGSSATIVALFLLAKSIWDWIETIKTSAEGARKIFVGARRISRHLFELGPTGAVMGFVISVVILALQATWLGLSYLIGNGLSWFIIGNRPGFVITNVPGISNSGGWNPFISGLRWDWVSVVYVAAAAVTLLLTYQAAFGTDQKERASRAITFLTVPLIIVGVLSGLSALVAGIAFAISQQPNTFLEQFPTKTFATMAVVSGAYIVASRTIAQTPALIAQVWGPIQKSDLETLSYQYSRGYPSRFRILRRPIIPAVAIIGVVLATLIATGVSKGPSKQIAQPHPSTASEFPPLHPKLVCIPDQGGPCGGASLHGAASVLVLGVHGLTQDIVDRLCAKGYRSKWSQNMGGHINQPAMCRGPVFLNGIMAVPFHPPTRKGRWVIVWRLYNPSGRLVRKSRYKAMVAGV
jgi:hypothetical protein